MFFQVWISCRFFAQRHPEPKVRFCYIQHTSKHVPKAPFGIRDHAIQASKAGKIRRVSCWAELPLFRPKRGEIASRIAAACHITAIVQELRWTRGDPDLVPSQHTHICELPSSSFVAIEPDSIRCHLSTQRYNSTASSSMKPRRSFISIHQRMPTHPLHPPSMSGGWRLSVLYAAVTALLLATTVHSAPLNSEGLAYGAASQGEGEVMISAGLYEMTCPLTNFRLLSP